MPDPELRDASRDGTSNSHWEARRRAERQQKGLIATTGRRTLATFTQLAKHERVEPVPSDDDIDEYLQSMLKVVTVHKTLRSWSHSLVFEFV